MDTLPLGLIVSTFLSKIVLCTNSGLHSSHCVLCSLAVIKVSYKHQGLKYKMKNLLLQLTPNYQIVHLRTTVQSKVFSVEKYFSWGTTREHSSTYSILVEYHAEFLKSVITGDEM